MIRMKTEKEILHVVVNFISEQKQNKINIILNYKVSMRTKQIDE
jgi:hypothetical protein